MTFAGLAWCHVAADSHPLHLARILRAEGRWNDPRRFGALYLCTGREGAVAEYRKAVERGEIGEAHHLASVRVNGVRPVADLLATPSGLPEIDRAMLTDDGPAAMRYCRQLARAARRAGYGGLLVPSAALEGATNLVIYLDVVPPPQVDLVDGPDRIPLEAPRSS